MKKYFLLLCIIVMCITSCNSDDDLNSSVPKPNKTGNIGEITLEDGYLKFASERTFEDFIKGLNVAETQTKSLSLQLPRGFVSISSMQNMEEFRTKSVSGYDDADEEMNEDEYKIMVSENLLLDPILTEIMDTTLRVNIADRIYKITEHGTFSTTKNNTANLEKAINNFDPSILVHSKFGEYINLDNNVVFIKSFDEKSKTEDLLEEIVTDEEDMLITKVMTKASFNNDLHNDYNVNSYKWKNNSLWQKLWDKTRGKDVSKSNKFSKNRRVEVNVYNVNYGFYASAGVKVKMQKRKKFCGITHWKSTTADKMVVGFNKVYGEMRFTNPQSFSKIRPTASNGWELFSGTISGTINNQTSNFVYGQYKKFDLVKDWVDDIYMFMPEVEIRGNVYPNQGMMNNLYNIPADKIFSFLKGQTNRWLDNIKKKIQPKDPRIAYMVWGNTNKKFNKAKPFIMGVKEYGARSSKSIYFDQSFGFTINNRNVGGFVPSEFKIKEIDAFGAAYYYGQWKGVRIFN